MRVKGSVALVALSLIAVGTVSQSGTAAPPGTRGFQGSGHSSVAGCPDLVWRLVRNGGNVTGITFFSDMSGVSEVKGTVNDAGQFHLTMTPAMANGPSGTVDGTRRPNGAIQAQVRGQGCANMQLSMQPITDVNHWTNFGGGGSG